MSLTGCQINPIDVNFHHQKFGNFDKNSADKIWPKDDKEIKVSSLMQIKVKKKTETSPLPFPLWISYNYDLPFVIQVEKSTNAMLFDRLLLAQRPRMDLNKRFLPRPNTTTAWKLTPHRSSISKN